VSQPAPFIPCEPAWLPASQPYSLSIHTSRGLTTHYVWHYRRMAGATCGIAQQSMRSAVCETALPTHSPALPLCPRTQRGHCSPHGRTHIDLPALIDVPASSVGAVHEERHHRPLASDGQSVSEQQLLSTYYQPTTLCTAGSRLANYPSQPLRTPRQTQAALSLRRPPPTDPRMSPSVCVSSCRPGTARRGGSNNTASLSGRPLTPSRRLHRPRALVGHGLMSGCHLRVGLPLPVHFHGGRAVRCRCPLPLSFQHSSVSTSTSR